MTPPRVPTVPGDEMSDLRERVAKLEWWHEQVDRRLGEGAEQFSELRRSIANAVNEVKEAHDRIKDAIAPKPTQWAKVGGILFAIVVTVMAWVWQAARYPTRGEMDELRGIIQTLQIDQAVIERTLKP